MNGFAAYADLGYPAGPVLSRPPPGTEVYVLATRDDYSYNLQGRLEEADVKVYNYWGTYIDDQTISTYTYNDQGIRVQQTEQVDSGPIEITHQVIDANNPTGYAQVLEEWVDTDGPQGAAPTLKKSYTLGHDVIAQADDAGNVHFFLYDGHGSTRSLADDTGNIMAAADDSGDNPVNHLLYDAYGNALNFVAATAATSILYSGEQFDAPTGLQYLRAGYYDLATGRFNRLDPFGGMSTMPASLHKYIYTHDDPINGIDPSGLLTLTEVNFVAAFRAFLRTIRQANIIRTFNRIVDVVDVITTFTDLVQLFRSSPLIRDHFRKLQRMARFPNGNRDVEKLNALTHEHLLAVTGHVARDLMSIVKGIRRNHGPFLRRALADRKRATLLIGLPSLPGDYGGRVSLRTPRIPLGPFRVRLVASLGDSGGSFIGFGLKHGNRKVQLFRLDYHGTRKGREPDASYFQAGPRILGQSFRPWFHYHLPRKRWR